MLICIRVLTLYKLLIQVKCEQLVESALIPDNIFSFTVPFFCQCNPYPTPTLNHTAFWNVPSSSTTSLTCRFGTWVVDCVRSRIGNTTACVVLRSNLLWIWRRAAFPRTSCCSRSWCHVPPTETKSVALETNIQMSGLGYKKIQIYNDQY